MSEITLAEVQKMEADNRQWNRWAMDCAQVPSGARRGFVRATGYGMYRICEIRQHAGRWIVVVGYGEYTRYGWIVGPRGRATQAY